MSLKISKSSLREPCKFHLSVLSVKRCRFTGNSFITGAIDERRNNGIEMAERAILRTDQPLTREQGVYYGSILDQNVHRPHLLLHRCYIHHLLDALFAPCISTPHID